MVEKSFEEMYDIVIDQYERTKKLYSSNNFIDAVKNGRLVIEGLLKTTCLELGIETSKIIMIDGEQKKSELSIEEMTEKLFSANYINLDEKKDINNIRYTGNKATHFDEKFLKVSLDEQAKIANDVVADLENILNIFKVKQNPTYFYHLRSKNNIPEKNPSYYSSKARTYFGKWYLSHSREDLKSDSDYIMLERMAEKDDINAMLDIASGFLSKKDGIFWNDRNLICMPKYFYNGEEYFNPNAYDTRYYYWVIKACMVAVECEKKNEYYPKKYIANALLDAIKFILYTRTDQLNFYISKVCRKKHDIGIVNIPEIKKNISNQYQEILEVYGEDIRTMGNIYDFEVLLLQLIEEYGTDIITIHQENTPNRIKYLVYCYAAICGERNLELDYVPSELIDESDKQHNITVAILQKYINDPVCRLHYAFAYNQLQIICQQNQRQINQQAVNSSDSSTPVKPSNKKAIMIIAVALFVIFVLPLASKLIFSAISNAPKRQPKLSATEIKDNSFDFSFKKDKERKGYSFITEKEGKYRFDFGIDDINCTYLVALYNSESMEIFDTMCNKDYQGQSCNLKANEEYTIIVTQYNGYPNAKITINEPTDMITVKNYEVVGSFAYTEQENIYSFHINKNGLFNFEFNTNDVKNNYNVALYSSINEELFSANSSCDDKSIKLNANEDYKLVLTQNEGFPEYKVTIHEPTEPVTVDGSFSGEIIYTNQENIYLFTPQESGAYKITFNSGIETISNNQIMIYDDKNIQLLVSSFNNYPEIIDLEEGKQYTFIITSSNKEAKYNVNIEKMSY